jgi:hypothetical protein
MTIDPIRVGTIGVHPEKWIAELRHRRESALHSEYRRSKTPTRDITPICPLVRHGRHDPPE